MISTARGTGSARGTVSPSGRLVCVHTSSHNRRADGHLMCHRRRRCRLHLVRHPMYHHLRRAINGTGSAHGSSHGSSHGSGPCWAFLNGLESAGSAHGSSHGFGPCRALSNGWDLSYAVDSSYAVSRIGRRLHLLRQSPGCPMSPQMCHRRCQSRRTSCRSMIHPTRLSRSKTCHQLRVSRSQKC